MTWLGAYIGSDVYTTISAPGSVSNGAIANLVLCFGNQGAVAAQGVTYQLTLPTTVTEVSCGGTTCSFNATTGVLTLTDLPTTLVQLARSVNEVWSMDFVSDSLAGGRRLKYLTVRRVSR